MIKTKLNSNLTGLSKKIRSRLDKKLFAVAQEIASLASQLAPVDTGHLAYESISVQVTVSSGIYRVVVKTQDADHPEYSFYVEYGTSRMAAQPFLRPAAESVRARLDQMLRGLL